MHFKQFKGLLAQYPIQSNRIQSNRLGPLTNMVATKLTIVFLVLSHLIIKLLNSYWTYHHLVDNEEKGE
jgi:hypothetical protein